MEERPLTAVQRGLLQGAPLDLEEFQHFLCATLHNSPGNVRTTMRQIALLASGEGVTSRDRSGTFYGRGPDHANRGTAVSLDQDLVELKERAKRWLHPRSVDKSKGWTLDHPIKKLILFQRHKFEMLANSPEPPSVASAPAAPAASAPVTPVKSKGKKRPIEASPARAPMGLPSAETARLQRELSRARADTHFLHSLSIQDCKRLKRDLQAALQRCDDHLDKLHEEKEECSICRDNPKQVALTCGHCLCETCADKMQRDEADPRCPECRAPFAKYCRVHF